MWKHFYKMQNETTTRSSRPRYSRTQTATISKISEWKKIRHQLQQNKHHESSKFYATSILSSTLPQYQVLRYPNIKFYATSTKTQNAGGEEEDASESRHGGENEDENNKDKSFKKADSTSQPKNITTISHGNCVSCDVKVSKTNTKKK